MKRRNTESSMQLALQAAPSNEPEPEIFWVTERSLCNEDVAPRVPRISVGKRHSSITRNKRNRPRNSSVWPPLHVRNSNVSAMVKYRKTKTTTLESDHRTEDNATGLLQERQDRERRRIKEKKGKRITKKKKNTKEPTRTYNKVENFKRRIKKKQKTPLVYGHFINELE